MIFHLYEFLDVLEVMGYTLSCECIVYRSCQWKLDLN